MQESILIIGRPDSGKTRFLTQFCARAEKGKSAVKFFDRANDISHISEDRKRSAQGLSSVRTASDVHIDVDLHIEVEGKKRTINYPDVAGEQINQIVKNRLINKKWQKQIFKSNHWMIFVRASQIKKPFDLSSKLVKSVASASASKEDEDEEFGLSDQGFLIELIQMMLYIKGIGVFDKTKLPKLSIVLTCWDVIEPFPEENTPPRQVLEDKKVLPLFSEFLHSIWDKDQLGIYGLSSQGQELKEKEPDEDYIGEGPENKGYMIFPDGRESDDITRLISDLLV